jgi:HSF-type DNA-binding
MSTLIPSSSEMPAEPMSAKDSQAHRLSTKLMSLLDDDSAPKALWWLDDQVFAVDPKFFQTQVLDPHFRGTKYASFLRTMHKM